MLKSNSQQNYTDLKVYTSRYCLFISKCIHFVYGILSQWFHLNYKNEENWVFKRKSSLKYSGDQKKKKEIKEKKSGDYLLKGFSK